MVATFTKPGMNHEEIDEVLKGFMKKKERESPPKDEFYEQFLNLNEESQQLNNEEKTPTYFKPLKKTTEIFNPPYNSPVIKEGTYRIKKIPWKNIAKMINRNNYFKEWPC